MSLAFLRRVPTLLRGMGVDRNAAQNAILPTVTIDEKKLWHSVHRVDAYLDEQDYDKRKTLFAIMRTEWGNLAGDILNITPPFDRGGKVSDGIKDVQATVRSAFKPLNSIPFGDLVRAKNWRAVEAYGYKFKNKRLQDALEKRKWNVIGNLKFGVIGDVAAASRVEPIAAIQQKHHRVVRDARTGRWNGTQFHVAGKSAKRDINQFAKEAAKNVGLMGSGWAYCHDKLRGGRKIPKLKYYDTGSVVVAPFGRKGVTARVKIINRLGNWGGWLGQKKASQVKKLIDSAIARIQKAFNFAASGVYTERQR